ncbi:hypothetical protein BI49514_03241 [Brevibacterium iodinum ATCC 49514]|uniref:Uncharacterized protein n=1 Tax=Brevibacterium iodinum ATCC 49514 TaxID=1255616 RepID=A0A2H1KQR1_9MICO|nr:hypothetical protein [Brevibacterium iodinum]SMY02021.1 hypothetical protein BI49514_03241 [Brevibacterium iodinum ATCC 49514]
MKLPAIYEQSIDDLENFEMSGDDLAVISNSYQRIEDKKEAAAAPMPRKTTASHQCQITQQEDEMPTTNSTNVPAQKSPTWAVPAKRWQSGTDVMHQGVTRRLERLNKDGSEYHFEVELTQLEEDGSGVVTDPCFCVRAGGEGTYDAVFTVDIAERENVADWLCSIVEKAQQCSDGSGLKLNKGDK